MNIEYYYIFYVNYYAIERETLLNPSTEVLIQTLAVRKG